MLDDQSSLYSIDTKRDEEQLSNKLKKLVDILNDNYEKNPHLKTIIFVKDRSVAVYLKKMLTGSRLADSYRSLDEGYIDAD
jgi:ERCC4-related helicase